MDNPPGIAYNIDKDVNDDENSNVIVEKIDKSSLENVTDPGCRHSRTQITPADDEYDAPIDEVKCLDCVLGWHVRRVSS